MPPSETEYRKRIAALEKENRVLKKSLLRCERNLTRFEMLKDRNEFLLKTVILEMKEAQQKLEKKNQQFGLSVEELEEANTQLRVTQEELEVSQQKLEAQSQAKSAFMARVSHELRAPMNAVLGLSQLLLGTELTAEQEEFLRTIRDSSEALTGIVNDLMDFSKIEVQKLSIKPVSFDLLTAVERLVALFAKRVQEKGIELILRYAPYIPRVITADPIRIRQILTNFIDNAIKFTDEGYILVEVDGWLEDVELHTLQLELRVKDSGIGIPQSREEQLFEIFVQDDSRLSQEQNGGLGLGLAICKQLADLMGGGVKAHNNPEGGATFCCNLPCTSFEEASQANGDPELRHARVLLVDPNQTVRKVLAENLSCAGIDHAQAESLADMERLLNDGLQDDYPFHFVLVDEALMQTAKPGLIWRLKAEVALRSLHFVVLCPQNYRSAVRTLQEDGFAGYLVKPVRPSQMLSLLSLLWRKGTANYDNIDLQELQEPEAFGWRRELMVTPYTLRKFSLPMHVLVVDDDLISQKVVSRMLENFGCQVEVASDGREAIEKVEGQAFDLLLMDRNMPKMDGLEVTRLIREAERAGRRRTPIVALSGSSFAEEIEEFRTAGADDHLAKPIQPVDLLEVLQHWYNRKGALLLGER